MQINRLNLIFPPATPAAPSASAQPDALQAESGSARAPSAEVAGVARRKAAAEPSAPATVAGATAGVTLDLGSSQKAASNGGVYTRGGVFAGRASAAVDQTPAEQFVASAVNTLRDFDIGKPGWVGESTSGGQTGVPAASRFGSFKQAVAKLNVFA